MSAADALLLVGGGFFAGVVNTVAGGGSLLTVPLLVLVGLPGTLANGTNRIGVLLQSLVASWRYRSSSLLDAADVRAVLPPVAVGALLGAAGAARVDDLLFERIYGVLMLIGLLPTLRQMSPTAAPARWSRATRVAVFFAIGLYMGAFQAAAGLPLLFALVHSGHDVVRANAVKMALVAFATALAVPVFVLHGQVAWLPAGILALGFAAGGALGPTLVMRGGDRLVRPVVAVAVVVLALRMLGLF